MTMSEVNATGMDSLYPGVCIEDLILMHTFPGGTCKYRAWADTLLVNFSGNLRASINGREEVEAHADCIIVGNNLSNLIALLGFYRLFNRE